jgi:hypothetical protein
MGWSIGYDTNWHRDIGYGVPAECDHPDCEEQIDRGLGYVCGGDLYGGDNGCGLFFCGKHLFFADTVKGCYCEKCVFYLDRDIEQGTDFFDPKPDIFLWIAWKLTDSSWHSWRMENPEEVEAMEKTL